MLVDALVDGAAFCAALSFLQSAASAGLSPSTGEACRAYEAAPIIDGAT